MNIGVQVCFQIMVVSGYMPQSGVEKLYDNSIFGLLRKLHTVFHSVCASLQSHQQSRWVPFSPYIE